MNLPDAERFLYERTRFGMVLGLDRMRSALRALGNPERAFRSVHVAGTNGKGSTCAFVESALRVAGIRTGLYTSPHLVRLAERFRVAGEEIEEAVLVRHLERILSACPSASAPQGLTFFELVTLIALLHFAESRVEVAVIETGLGGRLDATNVLAPEVSVLTPIGLDHTDVLGSSLASVAAEKAGILKPSAPAVSARQEPEAAQAIARAAEASGAGPLRIEGQDFALHGGVFRGRSWTIEPLAIGLRGAHQRTNAAVAAAALEVLAERGWAVTPAHVRRGLAEVRWPGRLETVRASPEVVLDGAHNPAGAAALARAMAEEWGRRAVVVFGAMRDKEAGAMLAALAPVASGWHLCAAQSPRARPAAELRALPALAGARAAVHADVPRALEAAMEEAGRDGLVLVTGSLYVVGEARQSLLGAREGMRVSEGAASR